MESEREALAEQPVNVEVKTPAVSKLPMSASKLPQLGRPRLPQPVPQYAGAVKRRISPPEEPADKKAKLSRHGSASSLAASQPATKKSAGASGIGRANGIPGGRVRAVAAPRAGLRRSVSTSALNKMGSLSGLGGGRTLGGVAPRKGLNSTSSARSTVGRPPSGKTATGSKTATSNKPAAKPEKAAGATAGKKRPAWDLKGRLQDMEALMSQHLNQNDSLQKQLLSNSDRVAMLEMLNTQLEGTVAQKEEVTQQVSQQIEELQKKLRDREEELADRTRQLQRDIENLEFSKSTLERHKSTLEGELSASREECSGLKGTVASLSSAQAGIKAELEATQMSLKATVECGQQKDKTITELRGRITAHEATIDEMSGKLRDNEMTRRKLHNTIQELKGNIRVFCRVRPLLGDECLGNDGIISHIAFPDDDNKILELEKLADQTVNESTIASMRRGTNNRYEFNFDRVFQPTESQTTVFDEISQLVQSALDGFNVCIFAYGQTGSGKTHTMEGPVDKGDMEQQGMIPRAVQQIFQTASELTDKGWEYEFEASFLEIYNESIRDLLGCGKETKHEIKMVAAHSSEVAVTNMTSVKVLAQDQVHSLLLKASENRAVAETKCNERSSRSHSIFRLKITGHNTHTDDKCIGELNLIDLAGSERLKESGSQGARLKETQSINKSLANLGNVIMALANKEAHVPYRNSKLTHLLQHSLGGNSKTLMFVNVSPKEECFGETLNSLRFATKVNNCMIGTATRKVK